MMDDKKIQIIIESLRTHALGDINKASGGGSKMGAFILCSCLIDAMAGFIKGKKTNGIDYKDFVRDYLVNYDPEKLYTDLRCDLVHNYSEGGSYLFVDAEPDLHLEKHSGRTIINLENFISDIEKALKEIEHNLLDPNETDLRLKAVSWFDKKGIIQVFNLNSVEGTPPVSGADSEMRR